MDFAFASCHQYLGWLSEHLASEQNGERCYEKRDIMTSLEIFGVTIPNLSAAHAAQWIYTYVSPALERNIPTAPPVVGFLVRHGGHRLEKLCPVFNTNTTFWTTQEQHTFCPCLLVGDGRVKTLNQRGEVEFMDSRSGLSRDRG